MTIHIGYDREEDKIELILPSQGNVITTLATFASFKLDKMNTILSKLAYVPLYVHLQKEHFWALGVIC